MRQTIIAVIACAAALTADAEVFSYPRAAGDSLHIQPIAANAVRVRIGDHMPVELDDLIYSGASPDAEYTTLNTPDGFIMRLPGMSVEYSVKEDALAYYGADGHLLLRESPNGRTIKAARAQELPVVAAGQSFVCAPDEHLFGTGQFQDGYVDIRGLSRRLTQVNTQIALPFFLSSKGYGLLWNNYGLTDFNPVSAAVTLTPAGEEGESVVVDVTSTTGNRRERRDMDVFEGEIVIDEPGEYSILLDVGQSMARKHNLSIDGVTLADVNNVWLPPTTSLITHLDAGVHKVRVEGVKGDNPTVGWRLVDNTTELASPVAGGIDYTVFAGSPDQVIASYRDATGPVPMLPRWVMGYTHCRERYDTQAELFDNAMEFRRRGIPIDCIVQDWQWWGKHGWNAMRFDEDKYPDPKAMTDSLHANDIRLMISVWAKFDHNCELGRVCDERGYYVPGTDWVDFFNPAAADFYWQSQSSRVLKPYGIDAWWQDATEPENDDLNGRRVAAGSLPGEVYRNVFPLAVNRRVWSGLRADDPDRRAMIMTRSGFPGIQRYGVFTWSGDVGHDWETLRRQIAGGLGQMASGLPWWTFDAGGFFRPGDQYTNDDYKEVMLRWVQTSVFLPMMRTHGYVSQTEPWRYGDDTLDKFVKAINLRYSLLPYNYTVAAKVSREGYTMMRPLVMDFPDDAEALRQRHQYMWGPSMLIAPVLAPGVTEWPVYLPAGTKWVDYYDGTVYDGGAYVSVAVQADRIPVMVKAGAIIPHAVAGQHSAESALSPLTIRVYPGADGSFTLYEDAGDGYGYERGEYSEIDFVWDDASGTLSIGDRRGSFPGMQKTRTFTVLTPDKSEVIVVNS